MYSLSEPLVGNQHLDQTPIQDLNQV